MYIKKKKPKEYQFKSREYRNDKIYRKKYVLLSDDTHSWLRVTIKEIVELRIHNQISNKSRMRGKYAYLDEMTDMQIFLAAKFNGDEDDVSYFVTNQVKIGDTWIGESPINRFAIFEYMSTKDREKYDVIRNDMLKFAEENKWDTNSIKNIQKAGKLMLDYWKDIYLTKSYEKEDITLNQ